MAIPWSTWEQTQYNLVQDFLDLFLPPMYTFSVETSYPKTASMETLIIDRFDTLNLPEPKLLHLEQLAEESAVAELPSRVGDWATLFAYEVLQGFGHGTDSHLQGAAFQGLKQIATTWGWYLAHEWERVFRRYELFTALGDFLTDVAISLFCQIPAKGLGEVIRESITPAYLRAGETVAYELALLDNNQARMMQSLAVLHAPDAELEREIANIFSGYSPKEIGRHLQQMTIQGMSQLKELFSSPEFREQFLSIWPIAFRQMSWYVCRRLSLNLQYDPQRTGKLLEAISRHKEIVAVVEQYRYGYGWGGDRAKAIRLGWQAVATKYFHLSGRAEDIHEDAGQEKFIGVAQGLEDYTDKNRAIEALTDGFLGKLGAYLEKAGENQETDYLRKQRTKGNIALTDALHAEDLRHQDREEDEALSDEEILSRAKEKYCPLGDPILGGLKRRETLREWWNELTDRERTAVTLMARFENQQKVADVMGISQPAASQLLSAAWRKYKKILKIAD